MFPAVKNVNIV